ncbi:uncharacterized protein LOC142333592 [Lycorma delicatula]|uniref:uncharacterized protein LOC142333592 n=1 Tax=Lycorma delicatula TaxID=130591 RepID=UPI003F50DE07
MEAVTISDTAVVTANTMDESGSIKIMNGPVNNTFINEALPLNKVIKLETEQDNVAEMICLFLPHHVTETDTSFEHIEEEIGFYQSHVTIDKGTIKESTKNCITCKRHVNNSLCDGVIKEKSIESSFKNVFYCTPLTLVTAQPFDDFIWKITILMSYYR